MNYQQTPAIDASDVIDKIRHGVKCADLDRKEIEAELEANAPKCGYGVSPLAPHTKLREHTAWSFWPSSQIIQGRKEPFKVFLDRESQQASAASGPYVNFISPKAREADHLSSLQFFQRPTCQLNSFTPTGP